jgi:hypothetical protein
MSASEDKRRHLDFIQLTITRMAANSFLLKAWTVTLVAAVFALSAGDTKQGYWLVAYVPVVSFWILDGYFLHQEKLYRKLYNTVRKKQPKSIDFSLDATPFKDKSNSWLVCMGTKTLMIFYGAIFSVLSIVAYLTIITR